MAKNAENSLRIAALDKGAGKGSPSGVTSVDRWVLQKVLDVFPERLFSFELWDGTRIPASASRSGTVVRIADRRSIYHLLRNPRVHFGDLYSIGAIDVNGDLVAFLGSIYLALDGRPDSRSLITRLWRDPKPRSTSLRAAKDNIHHHYDLGNDFYALWLDREAMQYTCAYYPEPAISLEQAQVAKMDHVCRKLRLRPGQRVVEAGCGWGGLALHMAKRYGVEVHAYNISKSQIDYATGRAKAEGLSDRVHYVLDDYRNIEGEYDVFVSVGMLEHVGLQNYRALGEVIARCLHVDGIGLVHSIGRNRPMRMNGWIEKRIFPGGYPPSLAQMMAVFEPTGMSVLDVENLRLHYALTLRHWLERFDANEDEVRSRYDETFVRAWRLYLSGSIAAFETGSMQLFQVLFARDTNNAVPMSRAYIHASRETHADA